MSPKDIYIIAEAGVNHNGSLELAKKLVEVAADSAADAVKFQTFNPEKLLIRSAPKAEYQSKNVSENQTQFEMLSQLQLGRDDHFELLRLCKERNIEFLSTPFDIDSLNFLANEIKVSRIKIASGEITNSPLLLSAARIGKPIILSTGMSTMEEIEAAFGVLAFGYTVAQAVPSIAQFEQAYKSENGRRALKSKVALLQCTSEYPAPLADANLLAMETMHRTFGVDVGFSDHTEGIVAAIIAAARGACIIEKHFTLDRNLPGPDHKASLEPDELRLMIRQIREVRQILGSAEKAPVKSELKNRSVARRSLVAARNIKKGEAFSEDNLTAKRPGTGVSPRFYWERIGKLADRDYSKDEVVDS